MSLTARLERPLPASLPVGRATAVFLIGTCWHPERRVVRLELGVDDRWFEPSAFAMPRPDVAGAGAPAGHYFSGFWGTVPIDARAAPGRVSLAARARIAGGELLQAALGSIPVVPAVPPPRGALPAAPVAICMATFEPDLELFAAQLDSLRGQSEDRFTCVVSDDCSSPELYEQLQEAIGGDPRFAISRSEQRLGFYRNFERALAMAPAEAELIALCDQDDVWYPDKLAALREALGGATLAYSDQRLVRADGTVLRETLWRGRRNNYDDLASMLVANTVTGASMLMRRELLELALPFPDTPGFQFHDHWLSSVALAAGEVAYVDRPLYDYVQHPGAVFGDVTHGPRRRRRRGSWRAAYFHGYLAREVQARVLLARCGSRLTGSKRRALERLIAADRSTPALVWLASRTLRTLIGRTETLGSELELARGVMWKRVCARWPPRLRRPGGRFADASVPPADAFSQRRLRRWRAAVSR